MDGSDFRLAKASLLFLGTGKRLAGARLLCLRARAFELIELVANVTCYGVPNLRL